MTDKIFYYKNGRCTPKEFKLDYNVKNKTFYLTINAYGSMWIEKYKRITRLIETLTSDWYFKQEDVNDLFNYLNIIE